jgi:guanylate kinase
MAEVSHWAEYDYVLVNHDLDETDAEVGRIVAVERLRRERQPWLTGFVRDLAQEVQAAS